MSIRDKLTDEMLQSVFGPEIERAEKAQARMAELRTAIADAQAEVAQIDPQVKPLQLLIFDAQDEVKRVQAHLVSLQRDAQILADRRWHLGTLTRRWQEELATLENPAPKGEVLHSAYTGRGPTF